MCRNEFHVCVRHQKKFYPGSSMFSAKTSTIQSVGLPNIGAPCRWLPIWHHAARLKSLPIPTLWPTHMACGHLCLWLPMDKIGRVSINIPLRRFWNTRHNGTVSTMYERRLCKSRGLFPTTNAWYLSVDWWSLSSMGWDHWCPRVERWHRVEAKVALCRNGCGR